MGGGVGVGCEMGSERREQIGTVLTIITMTMVLTVSTMTMVLTVIFNEVQESNYPCVHWCCFSTSVYLQLITTSCM